MGGSRWQAMLGGRIIDFLKTELANEMKTCSHSIKKSIKGQTLRFQWETCFESLSNPHFN